MQLKERRAGRTSRNCARRRRERRDGRLDERLFRSRTLAGCRAACFESILQMFTRDYRRPISLSLAHTNFVDRSPKLRDLLALLFDDLRERGQVIEERRRNCSEAIARDEWQKALRLLIDPLVCILASMVHP